MFSEPHWKMQAYISYLWLGELDDDLPLASGSDEGWTTLRGMKYQ